MTFSTPQAIIERLAEIEKDLADRQNEWENSAGARARLARDWEKRYAIARKIAKGNDADTRKAAALVIAAEEDDLFDRLRDAEDAYEACKSAIKVMELRVGIGQSILKAQGRA